MGSRASLEMGGQLSSGPGAGRQGGSAAGTAGAGIGRGLALALVVAALVVGGVAGGVVSSWLHEDPATYTPPSSSTAWHAASDPNIPAMVAEVQESVVAITVVTRVQVGNRSTTTEVSGTGVVLTRDGMIATNAHVVADAVAISVTLPDGDTVDARVLGADDKDDLAVIAVDRDDLVPIRRGTSAGLLVGEPVVAVGFALGLEGGPTVTMGIVSALGRRITTAREVELVELIQTDAAINEGDSGGPLVAHDGALVGIATACSLHAENIGFAIAIDSALPTLRDLAGRSLD